MSALAVLRNRIMGARRVAPAPPAPSIGGFYALSTNNLYRSAGNDASTSKPLTMPDASPALPTGMAFSKPQGRLVLTRNTTPASIAYSDDTGDTWAFATTPPTEALAGATWVDAWGLFVAWTDFKTVSTIWTSPNGLVWTARVTPMITKTAAVFAGFAWSPSLQMLVLSINHATASDRSTIVSYNGITWTLTGTSATLRNQGQPFWSPTRLRFYLVSAVVGGSNYLSSSQDGTTWSAPATSTNIGAGQGSLAVRLAAQTTRILLACIGAVDAGRTSTTLTTWASYTVPGEPTRTVKPFLAQNDDGTIIVHNSGISRAYSTDGGLNWTALPNNSESQFWMAYFGDEPTGPVAGASVI